MTRSNVMDFTVQFQHQTDAAICIREVEDGPDIWIPKSRCEVRQSDPRRNHYILVTMDEDIAAEKGLV